MSTDLELNLDALFLPSWAQQPANKNLYAKYEGREENRDDRRGGHGDRPRPPFRGDRPRGQGQGGDQRGPRPPQGDRQGGRPPRRGGPPQRGGERRFDRDREPRPEPEPLPAVDAQIRPDDGAVEVLTREIKAKGRAYPLFGLAQIVLEKPERHKVKFIAKKTEGGETQPLFVCALDDTLWLSEEEVVAYILSKH